MKNFKRVLFIVFVSMAVIGGQVYAQEQKKVEEIKVKTSAVCSMCKKTIESNMAFEKGIKAVDLDLKTQIVTIKYKTAKTTPKKIRLAISKLGYDADDIAADEKAYKKLPACCKKDVAPH